MAPSRTRRSASMKAGCALVWKSTRKLSFLAGAFFPPPPKLGAGGLPPVGKVVRPGEYLVSPVGREEPCDPDAPAPAADDSQLDLWVGLGAPDEFRPQDGERHGGCARLFQETTPADFGHTPGPSLRI